MKKLLHIECSPRKERSISRKLAQKFIETYKLKHPHSTVTNLDLWETKLPEVDEFTVNAKFKILNQLAFDPSEMMRWNQILALFEQFNAADKFVFSVPMWNFSIPYKLKHYIDLITQPSLAFKITPNGYQGLVTNRPVVLILSRGGAYRNTVASGMDMQEKYLELWLKFIGFTDIRKIYAEPMAGPNHAEVVENAMEMVIYEAARF